MQISLVSKRQLHSHQISKRGDNLTSDCDCAAIPGNLDLPPLSYPTIYSLELTSSCNSRCPGCSNVFVEDKEVRMMPPSQRPMPIEQWRVILDKIAPHAQQLKLTGGEATLHPQFDLIIEAIKERNTPFTLFTNGRWEHPDRLIALLKETSQCVGLLVSLHGADAEAHEAFSGIKGSFNETVQNIRRATEAGLTVHTNAVFTRYNHTQIEDLVALSQSLGAERAVFNRYIGQPIPDLDLPLPDLNQAIREVDRIGRENGQTKFGTCIPLCFVESSSTGCLAGTAYCTIDPWGYIRPCNHAPQIAGNILAESLEAIWRSTTMEAWRNLTPSQCETCSAFSTCHGGCRADAALQGLERDPLMRVPLQNKPAPLSKPQEPLLLYEQSVPKLEYTLQEEFFGPILLKGSDIIPVSERARPILVAMDCTMTLRQLHTNFGDEAVTFVGQLYERGAISLEL